MPDKKNSLVDLQKYLSTPERPVKTAEMAEFWSSLNWEEKEEFKSADLSK